MLDRIVLFLHLFCARDSTFLERKDNHHISHLGDCNRNVQRLPIRGTGAFHVDLSP